MTLRPGLTCQFLSGYGWSIKGYHAPLSVSLASSSTGNMATFNGAHFTEMLLLLLLVVITNLLKYKCTSPCQSILILLTVFSCWQYGKISNKMNVNSCTNQEFHIYIVLHCTFIPLHAVHPCSMKNLFIVNNF